MKDEARSINERIEVEMRRIRPIRCPSSLRALAQALNRGHAKIGTLQHGALETALHNGALLHLAKSKLEHGKWLPWLEKHFDGDVRWAQNYMKIACAYATDPSHFSACESIEAALQVARELPKSTDLPAVLPELMEPPTLRVVQQEHESGRDEGYPRVVTVERADERLGETYTAAHTEISAAIERNKKRIAELEANREEHEVKEADARNHQIDAEFELKVHPDTPAGNAARKAEKLLVKAASTYGTPESQAYADKALGLIAEHKLDVMVVSYA